jgi:hypothetical protein
VQSHSKLDHRSKINLGPFGSQAVEYLAPVLLPRAIIGFQAVEYLAPVLLPRAIKQFPRRDDRSDFTVLRAAREFFRPLRLVAPK